MHEHLVPNREAGRPGVDDGDRDRLVGPRLSAEARVRVLRAALEAAELEAPVAQ
jgi:hypothetical protein